MWSEHLKYFDSHVKIIKITKNHTMFLLKYVYR